MESVSAVCEEIVVRSPHLCDNNPKVTCVIAEKSNVHGFLPYDLTVQAWKKMKTVPPLGFPMPSQSINRSEKKHATIPLDQADTKLY